MSVYLTYSHQTYVLSQKSHERHNNVLKATCQLPLTPTQCDVEALGIRPQFLSKHILLSLAPTYSVHADTVMRFMSWYSEDMRMKFTIPRNYFKMFLLKHHNMPHCYLLLCMWWPVNWNYHFPFPPLFFKIQIKNNLLKNLPWPPQV